MAAQYRDLRHKKLIDLIDKPQWSRTTPTGKCFVKQAEDTLIPDLISIVKIDGEYRFIIFDAKYYNIQLEHNKKLRGQPGIESITKQYLYQLAFRPFVEAHQISTVLQLLLHHWLPSCMIKLRSLNENEASRMRRFSIRK